MGSKTIASTHKQQSSQQRKKLNKLRSVRVANLDRLRLSMKSRLSEGMVIPPGDDDGESAVQESLKGLSTSESPNYMKDTSCSSARKGSSVHPSTGDASAEVKSLQRIKKTSSLKRLKKASSFRRSRRASGKGGAPIYPSEESDIGKLSNLGAHPTFQEIGATAGVGSVDFLNFLQDDDESSTCGEGAQVLKTMAKSRSIKLTRVRSVKLSRRLSKSRFGSTSLFSPKAETNGANIPFDDDGASDSQTSIVNHEDDLVTPSRLRALRTLSKSRSLRSKRRVEKKGSRNARTRFDQATCSSSLRSSKYSQAVDLDSRQSESEEQHPMLHVCPYSYCSVHGNKRAGFPSLKGFVTAKRRTLKKQKSKRATHKYTTESTTSKFLKDRAEEESREMASEREDCAMNIMEETNHEETSDGMKIFIDAFGNMRDMQSPTSVHCGDTKEVNSFMMDETESRVSQIDDISVPLMISLKPEMLIGSPNGRHDVREPAKAKQETGDSNELSDQSLATESQVKSGGGASNSLLGRENIPNMWDLIFSRYLQPVNEQPNEVAGKEQGGPDTRDSSLSQYEKKRDMNIAEEDGPWTRNSRPPQHEKTHDLMGDEDENEDEDAEKETLELNQDEAIQLAQEAVDELLRLHGESADCHPMSPVQRDSHGLEPSNSTTMTPVRGNIERTNEKEDKGASLEQKVPEVDEHTTHELDKADSKEGKLLERQSSKGLAKLRKMIITAKSIKTMEKLMKIKSRKPHNLSSVASSVASKDLLRHRSMKCKRSAEELMLDHALQQVIAKLDPCQQRRVTLLIQAFETISPELGGMGRRSNPKKWQITNYTASQSTCERDDGTYVILHPAPAAMLNGERTEDPEGTTSPSDPNDSMGPLTSSDDMDQGKAETRIRAAPDSHATPKELCNHNITKPSKESHEEIHSGDDAQAAESLITCEMHTRELDKSDQASYMTPNFHGSAHRVYKLLEDDKQINLAANQGNSLEKEISWKSLGYGVLGEQSRIAEGTNGALEIERQYAVGGSEVKKIVGEGTSLQFDKQKFTNVWNMVYQHFVASESCESGNKPDLESAEKEQDEVPKNTRMIDRSDSVTSQKGLNQADAVQLVQEAIDELLRLHGQLSDQQSASSHNIQNGENNEEKINAMEPFKIRDPKDANTSSQLDGMQTEPEELDSMVQDPVQAPPSKAFGKMKSLMLSTKFIKAMQELRKISPNRRQNLSLKADSGPERVYLRHLSMDERRNSQEWMLDYALQQVLNKMDLAQQKRVAMLTQVFESVNPEIQDINAKQWSSGMPTANSVNLRENEEEIISEVQESPKNSETKVQQLEYRSLAEGSCNALKDSIFPPGADPVDGVNILDLNGELYKDSVEFNGVNLHMHGTDGSTEGCPVCYPERALSTGGEGVHSTKEKKQELRKLPCPSQEAEQHNSMHDAQAKLESKDYSKIWNLIYQQVKSRAGEGIDRQADEASSKEEQGNDSTLGTERESKGACHEGLELTQSDVTKIVQEALKGILKKSYFDQKLSKEEVEDGRRLNNINQGFSCESSRQEEERCNSSTISQLEDNKLSQGNKSIKKASLPHSRWKRALICSKFVTAMEKMQKFYPQGRRNNATESNQGTEVFNLRKCQLDDRSYREEWMFDYALQQVIAKLDPAQQKRVAMLVEAFETVAPTGPEETSKQSCCWNSEPSNGVSPIRNEEQRKNGDRHIPVDVTLQKNDESMTSGSHDKEEGKAGLEHRTGSLWKLRGSVIANVPEKQRSVRSMAVPDAIQPKPEKSIEQQEEIRNPNTIDKSIKDAFKDEDLEDDNNTKEMSDILSGTQRYSSMWKLIRKHLKAGTTQIVEEQIPEKPDADTMPLERIEKKVDSCRSSTEPNQNEADVIQDKDSLSINVQQAEAIKMVQEAVDEILHIQEPARGDQSTAVSPTLNQEDSSAPCDETVEMQDGDNSHDKLTRSYSAMSKIILCNKFIKAIEKMKKETRSRRRWSIPRQTSLDGETVTLRPQTTNEKNYDEWMLDNALQQVIGKLGPAQKKRVSSLVDAFEKFTPSLDSRTNPRIKTVAW